MTKIKNFFNKLPTYIKKGFEWIYDHKYISLLGIIAIVLVFIGINYLFSIKYHPVRNVQSPKSTISEVIEQIPNDAGVVKVAENDTKELYIDTTNTNIIIIDKKTGYRWESIGLGTIDNPARVSQTQEKYLANFEITYLRDDGTTGTMNGYTYSVKNGDYDIYTINNGVQITYRMQDKTIRIFEYIPKKISYERFEEKIQKPLDEIYEEGLITPIEYENFLLLWNSFYSKNNNLQAYIYSAASQPITSSAQLIVKIINLIGYTAEDLIHDNSMFDEKTEFTVNTIYTVILEVTLDGDDLLVNVPTGYAVSNNDVDQVQNISVFPYFGNVTVEKTNRDNPGYLFIPDGPGALVQLNSYNPDYASFSKIMYNNDAYDKYYLLGDYYTEEMYMPVFGMYNSKPNDENWYGFFTIIENGAELATLKAAVANRTSVKTINQVYADFALLQKSYVLLYGYYASDTTSHLMVSQKYDYNIKLRYKLLTKESEITYFDLVKVYQNYLIEKYNLERNHNYKPKMFIDLIGNVTVKNYFAGIPYIDDLSMTTFTESIKILEELEGVDKVVNYLGAINNGINQSLPSKIKFVKENGGYRDFVKLQEYVASQNDELFVNVNLLKVYGKDNDFKKKMAIEPLDTSKLTLYKFNLATGQFNFETQPYHILSPAYLTDVVNKFMKSNKYFNSISLYDLGSTYLVDYNEKNVITPLAAKMIEQENLQKLTDYNLILRDPYAENYQYADYITDLSRESSNYYFFTTSIPFKQLVLNGLVEYTTNDVNFNTYHNSRYYLLQALELGSHMKYTLSYKDSTLLKDTEFNYYNSTKYSTWIEDIKNNYQELDEAFNIIGTNEIVNHEMLAHNVFKTTYSSGVSVIVNYNLYDVTINDEFIIAGLSYIIEEE